MFIEQLKDIVDKAEDMLSEDTEGEKNSDHGGSPKQSEGAVGAEVRQDLLAVNSWACAFDASSWRRSQDDSACSADNKSCQKYHSCWCDILI